ncbi:MAG TPA: hypothetical protein VGQ41_06875 [Pyrinomonadaceae bacterium]|jgi:hypothetical protein|nr:hypothetical protein [Pyrinomonadaceae bacterium]
MTTPAKQLTAFIAKFDPSVAKLVRSARSVLRKRFPTAIELVYDNYNALAIGYSTSERVSDVLFSLAVYPRWVDLYFMYGRSLPDPKRLLQGSGKQGAFVRLYDPSMLDHGPVQLLLEAAVQNANSPLPAKGKGYTVIKSISAKQRPRRPTRG